MCVALAAGLPVQQGEKWIVNLWLRERPLPTILPPPPLYGQHDESANEREKQYRKHYVALCALCYHGQIVGSS